MRRPRSCAGLWIMKGAAASQSGIESTIGGHLTDYYGWPWGFYVNLAPGLVMLAALWFTLPKSAPQLGLLRQGDWFGIALMAVGLAAFQTVLDDGNVYNWFDSPFIVKLSLVAALALGAFVLWQFITAAPLVKFRLLGRRNFGLGTLGNFLLGFAVAGTMHEAGLVKAMQFRVGFWQAGRRECSGEHRAAHGHTKHRWQNLPRPPLIVLALGGTDEAKHNAGDRGRPVCAQAV
jgi:hypothetical protein